jgi:hypothetical protein
MNTIIVRFFFYAQTVFDFDMAYISLKNETENRLREVYIGAPAGKRKISAAEA